MRKNLHPTYEDATISCACGKSWETQSTKKETSVGICSACHPFFTGQHKFVDTAGRIDKFKRRYEK